MPDRNLEDFATPGMTVVRLPSDKTKAARFALTGNILSKRTTVECRIWQGDPEGMRPAWTDAGHAITLNTAEPTALNAVHGFAMDKSKLYHELAHMQFTRFDNVRLSLSAQANHQALYTHLGNVLECARVERIMRKTLEGTAPYFDLMGAELVRLAKTNAGAALSFRLRYGRWLMPEAEAFWAPHMPTLLAALDTTTSKGSWEAALAVTNAIHATPQGKLASSMHRDCCYPWSGYPDFASMLPEPEAEDMRDDAMDKLKDQTEQEMSDAAEDEPQPDAGPEQQPGEDEAGEDSTDKTEPGEPTDKPQDAPEASDEESPAAEADDAPQPNPDAQDAEPGDAGEDAPAEPSQDDEGTPEPGDGDAPADADGGEPGDEAGELDGSESNGIGTAAPGASGGAEDGDDGQDHGDELDTSGDDFDAANAAVMAEAMDASEARDALRSGLSDGSLDPGTHTGSDEDWRAALARDHEEAEAIHMRVEAMEEVREDVRQELTDLAAVELVDKVEQEYATPAEQATADRLADLLNGIRADRERQHMEQSRKHGSVNSRKLVATQTGGAGLHYRAPMDNFDFAAALLIDRSGSMGAPAYPADVGHEPRKSEYLVGPSGRFDYDTWSAAYRQWLGRAQALPGKPRKFIECAQEAARVLNGALRQADVPSFVTFFWGPVVSYENVPVKDIGIAGGHDDSTALERVIPKLLEQDAKRKLVVIITDAVTDVQTPEGVRLAREAGAFILLVVVGGQDMNDARVRSQSDAAIKCDDVTTLPDLLEAALMDFVTNTGGN